MFGPCLVLCPFYFVLHFITLFHQNMGQPEISVLTTYAQKPSLKAHAEVSSRARGQTFDLHLHLYVHPYTCTSSKGSGESALLRRLTRDFAA